LVIIEELHWIFFLLTFLLTLRLNINTEKPEKELIAKFGRLGVSISGTKLSKLLSTIRFVLSFHYPKAAIRQGKTFSRTMIILVPLL